MAKCVEELLVYQKALAAADEISAILKRDSLRKDCKLRDQLGASSEGVAALISEGFPQSTDRHFAHYLTRSQGSSSETRTHLAVAFGRGHLSQQELKSFCDRYNEIERMLNGLVAHLLRENRTLRGVNLKRD